MLTIFRSGDWEQLKAALTFSPSSVHLPAGIDDDTLNEACAAPVALAYALQEDEPGLLRSPMLRVLILNPDKAVMRHGLQAFAMMPALTSQPGSRFHVTLVGDAQLRSNEVESHCLCEEYEHVSVIHQDHVQFLAENTMEGNFDMAVFVMPSLDEKTTLPCLPGMAEMIASGLPVLMLGQDSLMTSLVLKNKNWTWAKHTPLPILPTMPEIDALALAIATHENDWLVQTLKTHPYWANTFHRNGVSLIHHAVIYGNQEALYHLHRSGADLSIRSVAGFSALHVALRTGEYPLADTLISLGADPDQRLPDLNTPLIDAAMRDDAEAVALLLEYGADPYEQGVNSVTFAEIAPFLNMEIPDIKNIIRHALANSLDPSD